MEIESEQKCKKLILNLNGMVTVVYGITIEETPEYFIFLTGNGNTYTVNKKSNFTLIPTNKIFKKRD